jgi:hypothetical protein
MFESEHLCREVEGTKALVLGIIPLACASLRFMQLKEPPPCSATPVATAASSVGYCVLDLCHFGSLKPLPRASDHL